MTPCADDEALQAYLTEQRPPYDAPRERPQRAILLLPGSGGWRCRRVRSLADRLAVFCLALVLVPDMHRGNAPVPIGQSPPAERVAVCSLTALRMFFL